MNDKDAPRPIYALESPTARTRMVEIGDRGAALEEDAEPCEVIGISPDTMLRGEIKRWIVHLRSREGSYYNHRTGDGQLYWVEPTYKVEIELSLDEVTYLESRVSEGLSAIEIKALQAYEDGKGA